ncbi:probable disease resistance protein At4g33300 [Punica granatum]|uniref:RPW8 domain-containing protein n=2 Tax=Punica granatum TaxID=22663 RepID=A0A218X8Q7_PUNGR|nr:probable disease resistance protein At4g33300 [Punica granatum]OWM80762.1 hypothetical protein CDL15_Pgr006792 [Punica granatum]PKI45463.1 hypothetical protein CRG98_034118 [Punica granatum]
MMVKDFTCEIVAPITVTDFTSEIATELIKVLAEIVRKSLVHRSSAKQLKVTIEELYRLFQQIKYSGVELPAPRQLQLGRVSEDLKKGMELCQKIKSLSRWNAYKNLQYARKLEKIEKSITRFIQGPMQLHMWADIHKLSFSSMERFDRMDGSMMRLEQQVTGMRIDTGGS